MKNKRHVIKKRAISVWLLIVLLVASGAGATAGSIISGNAEFKVAASQNILIDATNFSIHDLSSHAARRFVSVSDDGTAFSAAAEIATGEELVIELPLVNESNNDVAASFTLDFPSPLQVNIQEFWGTPSKTTTTTPSTTEPIPAPITPTLPQIRDSILTKVMPNGTPAISPQTAQTNQTFTKPTGSAAITPQSETVDDGAKPAGAWESGKTTVESGGDVGQYTSIAAIDQNIIYIAYYDASDEDVKFRKTTNGGTTWSSPVVVDSPPDGAESISMAVIGSDKVFIGYWAYDTGIEYLRLAASHSGGDVGSWNVQKVSEFLGGPLGRNHNIDVAAVAPNYVFVSYSLDVFGIGLLNVARSTDGGASWNWPHDYSPVTPAFGAPLVQTLGGDFALTAVDANTVFVTYTIGYTVAGVDTASLHVAMTTLGAVDWDWQLWAPSNPLAIVAPTSIAGIPTGVTVGDYTDIVALDSNNVYVSYSATPLSPVLGGGSAIGFSSSTGFPFFSFYNLLYGGVFDDDCGQYNSIAAVGDYVSISYYDYDDDDLELAYSSNGGSSFNRRWPGDGGQYTSIDLVKPSCAPLINLISHYDAGDEDLLFVATLDAGQTYYSGDFNVDTDADGVLETVNFVLTDLDSDGDIDRIDLSHDGTFGEGDLSDGQTQTDNDERFDCSTGEDIVLGTYRFTAGYLSAVAGGQAKASITSKEWYTGDFTIDADADTVADNTVNIALSDADSNGLYETMDISMDGTNYGTHPLDNLMADTGDDERITGTADIMLGKYTFTVEFDSNPPADNDDARITSYWYTGNFILDADGDELADDSLYFVLSDTDSDGVYTIIDLSMEDQDYGEGDVGDDYVDYDVPGGNTNDERFSWVMDPKLIKLGYHHFFVAFDRNPENDVEDASIKSTWYIGTFEVDIDGDQIDEVLDFALVDPDSDGLFTIINLDCNDSGFYTFANPDEELASGDLADLDGLAMRPSFPKNASSATLTDGSIVTVTRKSENQWLILIPAAADWDDVQDMVRIKIATPDDIPPGYYQIYGVLEPLKL